MGNPARILGRGAKADGKQTIRVGPIEMHEAGAGALVAQTNHAGIDRGERVDLFNQKTEQLLSGPVGAILHS
jgi:hypothetical protein